MGRLPLLTAGALLGAAALAGCGTAGDREAAQQATQALYSAVDRDDGTTACAQMSPSLRAALVADEGAPCRKAVLDLDLHGRAVTSVRVYATSAQARLDGGDTVFLGDTAEGWRVEALGCQPQGRKLYDCEAES